MAKQDIPLFDDKGVASLTAKTDIPDCEVVDMSQEEDTSSSFTLTQRVRRASRSGTYGTVPKTNVSKAGKKKPVSGFESFEICLREAEYEVNADPYRGIFVKEKEPRSPWLSCVVSGEVSAEDVRGSEASGIVLENCRCECPSLISWTNENIQTAKRRRKQKTRRLIGERNDLEKNCRCDSNPFCIVSVGGVMNDILEKVNDKSDGELIVVDGDREDEAMNKFDPDENDCVYTEETKTKLLGLRRQSTINTKEVSDYLRRTLQELVSALPVADALEEIRQRHKRLIFVNPLVDEPFRSKDRISVALPPGIENLGATCYLNTQLQCLARNLVFLDGILSWIAPPENNNPMTKVLQQFQSLLAHMAGGPRCTLNTLEFSNGLGLDHFEQQDPNEFSRLFFEKIHQTFATCNQPDLVTLLPHLFKGKTTYTTTCTVCKTKSTRTEDFMDVTLPIVVPSKQKKSGQQTIAASVKKSQHDTDVQFCIDEYAGVEKLDGDNQYHCDTCGKKVDAERATSFSELPPVLNIQLCRYVYDRVRGVKTKLQDRVLLPRRTKLVSDDGNGSVPKNFILCAVMVHKGKSAYSGHYIAEAMDWQTGQWFVFNDTKVEQLTAPSHSCEPSGAGPMHGDGSSDAYNMYYVEETFLAQSTIQNLRRVSEVSPPQIVEQVNLDLAEHFQDVSNLCLSDGRSANRLQDRKEYICEELLPTGNLADFGPSDDAVWIEGNFIRRYASCKDRLESFFSSDEALWGSNDILFCSHHGGKRGMHPRVARRGKLLPRRAYESLMKALSREQRSFDFAGPTCHVPYIGIDMASMLCEQCCESYTADLAEKVALCKKLCFLYEALDPAQKVANEAERSSTEPAYVVSRKFITGLRGRIAKLFKTFAEFENGVVPAHSTFDSVSTNLTEGLDSVDVKGIVFDSDTDTLDSTVNSAIVCDHGALVCPPSSKMRCRIVNQTVWLTVKELFPGAVELKFVSFDVIDEPYSPCQRCESEAGSSQILRDHLRSVATQFHKKHTSVSLSLDEIIQMKEHDEAKYRIVHSDDISEWQKSMKEFSGLKEDRCIAIKEEAKKRFAVAFSRTENSDTLLCQDCDCEMWALRSFQPISCGKHRYPMKNVIFKRTSTHELVLSDRVRIVEESVYQAFMTSLFAVVKLLLSESVENIEVDKLLDDSASSVQTLNWHAQFSRVHKDEKEGIKIKFHLNDESRLVFEPRSKLCEDPSCHDEFIVWERDHQPVVQTTPPKTLATGTGNVGDPITVDDVDDSTITVKVFHATAGARNDEVVEALLQCLHIPQQTAPELSVRRSSRKRNNIYPVGCLDGENKLLDVESDRNIAFVRLRMMEQNESFELDNELFIADVEIPSDSIESEYESMPVSDIPLHKVDFSQNDKSLQELSSLLLKNTGPRSSYVLVWKALSGCDMPREALMEHLISISSINDAPADDGKSNGKRKRNAERGFTGTLLTSSSPAPKTNEQDDDVSVDELPNKVTRVDASMPRAGTETASIVTDVNLDKRVDDDTKDSTQRNGAKIHISDCDPVAKTKETKLFHDSKDIQITGDPIVVDDVVDSNITVIVFHAESEASMDSIVEQLFESLHIPRQERGHRLAPKPNYFYAETNTLSIESTRTIAFVRLRLNEQNARFELDYELFIADVEIPSDSIESEYESMPVSDIPLHKVDFSQNDKSLQELSSLLLKNTGPRSSYVLVWKSLYCSGMPREALMEHLISISSINDSPADDGKSNGKRKRNAERGFTGTLLTSSSPAPKTNEQDDDVSVDELPNKVTRVDASMPRAGTETASTVSDANKFVDSDTKYSTRRNGAKMHTSGCDPLANAREAESFEYTEDVRMTSGNSFVEDFAADSPPATEREVLLQVVYDRLRRDPRVDSTGGVCFQAAAYVVNSYVALTSEDQLSEIAYLKYVELNSTIA